MNGSMTMYSTIKAISWPKKSSFYLRSKDMKGFPT